MVLNVFMRKSRGLLLTLLLVAGIVLPACSAEGQIVTSPEAEVDPVTMEYSAPIDDGNTLVIGLTESSDGDIKEDGSIVCPGGRVYNLREGVVAAEDITPGVLPQIILESGIICEAQGMNVLYRDLFFEESLPR